MVFKFIPSFRGVGDASFEAVQRDAVQHVAEGILAEAQRLARDAGLDDYAASLQIETLQRPKGRGDVRVIADDDQAQSVEWGDNDTDRLRILGRAANVQIFPDVPK